MPAVPSPRPSVNFCPFRHCGCRIAAGRFCCRRHWSAMSREERYAVYHAFEGRFDGRLTREGFADVLDRILEVLEAAGVK